jgi:glyoxylase-like metal-dependent hydrolase (beta-lactamase superfamily II)
VAKQVERCMAGIPFVRNLEFEYGRADDVSPLIRRVIANNPGPFTYTGTGVYIVGRGTVAVIDPGPALDEHFEALKQAVKGETVTHVLVTHSHMDHSPLAHPLAKWAGCEVYAGGLAIPTESEVRLEAGDDLSFKPTVKLRDGDVLRGEGWTIEAVATPGHTSNHFCFGLREENALFSGDHVMGWSTTVISPPDGHMGDYYASLEKIRARGFSTLWPTHGPPVREVGPFLDAYIAHRRAREHAILKRLEEGDTRIPDMVKVIYQEVDKRLHPAACHSVLAHMVHLVETGRVRAGGGLDLNTEYFAVAHAADNAQANGARVPH